MGSLFSPSVPQYPVFTYQPRNNATNKPTQQTPATNTSVDSESNPVETAQNNQQARSESEESVRDFIRRTNRGRSALIRTSYRGVLTDLNRLAPQRKNLLGE